MQASQVPDVAGDRAAPEADVDVHPAGRRLALDLQRRDIDGRRQAVERHVHDRGHPAGRGRTGRRLEALPLGAAGIVDVDVRVDQPGQQHDVVAEVEFAVARQRSAAGFDGDDPPAVDADGRRNLALGRDGPGRAHHKIHPKPFVGRIDTADFTVRKDGFAQRQ